MAKGGVLEIDAKFLKQLKDADNALNKISETSKKMQTNIIGWMQSINKDGVMPFYEKLQQLEQQYRSTSSTFEDVKGFKRFAQQAKRAADQINGLISAIEKTPEFNLDVNLRAKQSSKQYQEDYKKEQREREALFDKAIKEEEERKRKERKLAEEVARYEIEQEQKVFNRRRQAEADMRAIEQRNHKQRQREYEEMFRELDKQAKKESQMRASNYARIQRSGDTSKQAIAGYNRLYSDKGVQSLNNMNKVLHQLQDAQNKLNLRTDEGKKKYAELEKHIKRVKKSIDEASNSNKKFKNSQSRVLDTASQLQRRLALLFSVSAISGYINKLVAVRREFELQHKALSVLVRDVDAANELWNKTVALAVKSPFRVKELITYTKQLAAYRIETEQLYDTTKMLADVSAGLGVDMNRLILAFGQVRAAEFLRGTELRQFTEAGIPMLDELAKYFTELEGRAVSVADVFERISKRMVSFNDVENVFHRMTDAGGVFYKMQEEMSTTLFGMISNMHDQIDLMLNDIGKSQDGVMKTSIALVTQMVKNWRTLEPYIKSAGTVFLFYFGIDQLLKIAHGFRMLWGVISAHPIGAAITIIGALAVAIYQVVNAQSELNQIMQEVDEDVTKELEKSISIYHELAETINDATESNEERNKALDNLKSKFKDILPDQLLELEYVKQLADNYHAVEKAMMDYYNAKAREQKRDKIESKYADELYGTDIPELQTSYGQYIQDWFDEGKISEEQFVKLKAGLNGAIVKAVESAKNGEIKNSAISLQEAISDNLKKFADMKVLPTTVAWTSKYIEDLYDVVRTLNNYQKDISGIKGLTFETYDEEVASDLISAEKKNVETATNAFKKAVGLYEKYATAIPKFGKDVETQRKEIDDDVQKILNNLPQSMAAYSEYLKVVFSKLKENAQKGIFDYKASIQTIESELYAQKNSNGDLVAGFAKIAFDNVQLNQHANDAAKQMVTNFQEGLIDKSQGLEMTDFQNAVIEGAERIAEKFGVSVDVFKKYIPTTKDSLSTIRQSLNAEIENIEARIKDFKTSLTVGMHVLSHAVLDETKAQVEELKKQLPALKLFRTLLGDDGKKKTTGGGKGKDWWLEMVSGLKNLHSEFLTLRKDLDATEARALALEKFKGVFDEILPKLGASGKSINIGSLNFETEEGMIDAFTALKNMSGLSKEARLAIEKALTDIRGEIRLTTKAEADESLIHTIEGMFSDYELSLELEKLNIPPNLAQSLFGVDTMSLKELRSQLKSLRPQFVGTDMEKEYEAYLKKISEMEDKEQLERLKKYSQYLVKGMNERVKIKVEELRQIKEVEGESNFTSEQRTDILSNIRKETQGKLDKQEWEDFKGSSMYTMVFQDLESYGDKTIGLISAKLQELKSSLSNLDPTQVKEIVAQIEKIEKIQIERNPFKMLSQTLQEVKTLRSVSDLEKDLVSAESIKSDASAELKVIQDIQAAKQVGVSLDKISAQIGEENRGLVYETNEQLQSRATYLQAIVAKQDENIQQTTDDLGKHKKLANVYKAAAQETQMWQQNVNEMFGGIKDVMTAAGVEADSTEMVLVDAAQSMVDLVFQAVAFQLQLKAVEAAATEAGVAMNSMLGPIGWVVLALQAVATLLSSILGQGDKKKEKQIQALTERVKDLERAYENLEEATQAAYNIDSINSGFDAMKSNLQEQINATERMIQLEQDKKKTDHGKIAEWKRDIEDYRKQLQELEYERINQLGGIAGGDAIKSASENFVNAWIDAFRETGDGLSGLEEQFDEVFMNLVKKQVLGRGVDKMLEPLYKNLEGMLYDGAMDAKEYEDFNKEWNSLSPQINEFLTKMVNDLGIADDITKKTGELSGLQSGIQGITEDQADILAAYWSSVRFIVSNIEQKFTEYARQMLGSDANANPILGELKEHTRILNDIDDKLGSIIGYSGGAHVKTYLMSQ